MLSASIADFSITAGRYANTSRTLGRPSAHGGDLLELDARPGNVGPVSDDADHASFSTAGKVLSERCSIAERDAFRPDPETLSEFNCIV